MGIIQEKYRLKKHFIVKVCVFPINTMVYTLFLALCLRYQIRTKGRG